jgi:hypothetical protein
MTTKDEFLMSVVIRRRDDLELPVEVTDAVAMVRELLEAGAFLDVVQVQGIASRRSEVLDSDTPEGSQGAPQAMAQFGHSHD